MNYEIRNENYAVYKGRECRFFERPDGLFRLQTNYNYELIRDGFIQYLEKDLENKIYKDVSEEEIDSAFQVRTFCKFKQGKYYVENAVNDKVIMAPDDNTKIKLGYHP